MFNRISLLIAALVGLISPALAYQKQDLKSVELAHAKSQPTVMAMLHHGSTASAPAFPIVSWVFPTLTPTGTSCGTGNNSCIIYVDNTPGQGNDGTCAVQSPPVTTTPTAGTQCATIAHAATLLRTGKPDWLLIKTGDTFVNDQVGTLTKAGISASQPIVIATYGTGPRPIVKTAPSATGACIQAGTGNDNLFVAGIEWYSYQRDPSNASWNLTASTSANECMTFQQTSFNSLVFENNLIHFYQLGMDIETNGGAEPGSFCLTCFVTTNGNVVIDQYPANFNPHSQGAFFSGVSLTSTFDIYDGNGFNSTLVGPFTATMTCASPSVVTVTGTPFAFKNGSFVSFTGTPCTGFNTNTYYCAINVSGNTFNLTANSGTGNECPNGTTTLNGTGTSSGLGVKANDFGAQTFNRNLYTNATPANWQFNISSNSSAEGVQFRSGGGPVHNNVFFNDSECWSVGDDITGTVTGTYSSNTCQFSVSIAQGGTTPAPLARGDGMHTQDGTTGLFVTNNVFSHSSSGTTDAGINFNSTTSGASATGNVVCWPSPQILDQGTGNTTSPNQTSSNTSTCSPLVLPDATRTVATYDSTILGGPGTLSHFVACIRAQTMVAWNNLCTAPAVNFWIFPGYGLTP